MYKVLIVEDMDITREDIMTLIEWEKHGFELAASARNGKIGLDYAMRYNPDIILTDIKMPVMTGIELAEKVKKIRPVTKFIFLTAYEEFGLVKQALDMGVQSFILKYEINEELLLRELNKCVDFIEKERNVEKMTIRHRLEKLLGDTNDEEYVDKQYFQWIGRSYLLDIWRIKAIIEIGEDNLTDMLKKELQNYQFQFLCLQPREYIIFLKAPEYHSEQEQSFYLRKFILGLQQVFMKFLDTGVVVAVGGRIDNHLSIMKCRKKAEKLLAYRIFYKGSCILLESNLSPGIIDEEDAYGKLEDIQKDLRNNEFDKAREKISELFCKDIAASRDINLLKKMVIKLMYYFREKGYEINLGEFDDYLERVRINMLTDTVYHTEERFQYLLDILSESADRRYSRKIRDSLLYMRKHFTEDIGLNEVAEILEVSPIYLSRLFKKEVGITFSSYVTRLRIERAKELLRQGDKKIYEISEIVGYQTVQYFSKVFKRETGKTPKEFE